MRRIDDYEFRVWDELSKQMIHFTFGEIYHEFRQYYYGNYIEKNGRKIYLTAEGGQSNPELHVMQYTGLKDKNGLKIFEGDMLGGIWEGFVIGWCDSCISFQLFFQDGECLVCWGTDVMTWSDFVDDVHEGIVEVAGNIYGNSGLLEVVKSRVDVLEVLVDLSEKLLELHDSLDGSYENMKYERERILSLVDNIQEVLEGE